MYLCCDNTSALATFTGSISRSRSLARMSCNIKIMIKLCLHVSLRSDLECGAESVLQILVPHQPDVGLHRLGGDGVGPESKTCVLVTRDLLSQ